MPEHLKSSTRNSASTWRKRSSTWRRQLTMAKQDMVASQTNISVTRWWKFASPQIRLCSGDRDRLGLGSTSALTLREHRRSQPTTNAPAIRQLIVINADGLAPARRALGQRRRSGLITPGPEKVRVRLSALDLRRC